MSCTEAAVHSERSIPMGGRDRAFFCCEELNRGALVTVMPFTGNLVIHFFEFSFFKAL